MGIKCNIITGKIKELASQIGKSDAVTCNLVSVWQTENNSVEYPNVSQLKTLLKDKAKELEDIELAIPNYEHKEFDATKPLAVTSSEGVITLRLLPKDNPKQYFLDYISGKLNNATSKQKAKVFEELQKQGYTLEKIQELLPTTKDIYRFLLWHEMSHLQNVDRDTYYKKGKDLMTTDKIAIETRATLDALKKAEKWQKKYPVAVIDNTKQQSIDKQQSLPSSEIKINIYADTGENADLSNFSERPLNFGKITAYSLPEGTTSGAFKSKYPIYDIGKVTYSTKESPNYGESFVFDGLSDLFSGRRFKTVEGAFQAAKLVFTHPKGNGIKGNKYWQPKEYTQRENSIDGVYYNTADVFVLTDEGKQLLQKFQEASGAQARSLGRQIEGLDRQEWDANSSKIMKAVIGRSFEANPQALQRLLATGNAILTHTQDKGKWGTEFPKLLMEVREELRGEQPVQQENVQQAEDNNVVMTLKLDDKTEVISQEESNDVYAIPEIGSDVLVESKENPIIKFSREFSATERLDRINMLTRLFSDIVDEVIDEKISEIEEDIQVENSKEDPDESELNRLKQKLYEYKDSKNGRKTIITDVTLPVIFQRMKERIESYAQVSPEEYDADYGKGRGEYMVNAYRKVLDNWDVLLQKACMSIENKEKFRIVTVKQTYNDGNTTMNVLGGDIAQSTDEADNEEEELNDDDSGERISGNEGFTQKPRFTDPAKTQSKEVKKVLGNLADVNFDGSVKTDDLGWEKDVNAEYAHAVLINGLSSMVDSDDFNIKQADGTRTFPALEKLATKYPWVNQVIDALSENPSLISLFYADFRKDFIPYWIQYYDEKSGKWKTLHVNEETAFDSTKNAIINNYEESTILDKDSIYGKSRKLNKDHAKKGFDLAVDTLERINDFDEDDFEQIAENTAKMLKMVGLSSNPQIIKNLLQTERGIDSLYKTVNSLKNIFNEVQSENFDENSHLIETLSMDFNVIAKEVGLVSELDHVQSFRNGDKTYYSYSSPNYINTMVKIIKDDAKYEKYIEENFGVYPWFKHKGEWMSRWLKDLSEDENVRNQFAFKEVLSIDGVGYQNWDPKTIKTAFIREYFSAGINKKAKVNFAWYNFPILSDSPVAMFVKQVRYTDDFKSQLKPLLRDVVLQELYRIKLVKDRIENGVKEIANFDRNGTKLQFFPELNNTDFLDRIHQMKKENASMQEVNAYIESVVEELLNNRFENEFMKSNFDLKTLNNLKEDLIKEGVFNKGSEDETEETFRKHLEEYFWNQAYATTQIIEMTVTDLAYYKDDTDFQKRFKEIYASGLKPNTNSDFGKKIEKTIYLKDFVRTSNDFAGLKHSLNIALKEGRLQSFDVDNILDKFKNITVADAQAFRTLPSMRTVLDMYGLWTPEMEQVLNRLDQGEWDMGDFNVLWNTLKPFMYTQISKKSGVKDKEGNDILIKVGHQNKNSEFLLLAAYSTVANAVGKSKIMKGLQNFMIKHNIDVAQYESAVKAGCQKPVDLNYHKDNINKWKNENKKLYNKAVKEAKAVLKDKFDDNSIFEKLKTGLDVLLEKNKISQIEYNDIIESFAPNEEQTEKILEEWCLENGETRPDVVHELPYEDYVIQQPAEDHLIDAKPAVYGSQLNNLILADISDNAIFNVNSKDYTKKEIVELYHRIKIENLLDDFDEAVKEFKDIESLQKALLSAVEKNPKFNDLVDALQIIEYTDADGNTKKGFNIPLDDPATTDLLQEICTSVFKNRVTKQTIKGGACVLVANVGLTKELHVLRGEKGEVKGVQCYLPASSKQFYEPFLKTDSNGVSYLDINSMPEELKKLVGYRIPTEDKYSMLPLIIKGFLPQQNGSSIMLPADITQVAGSDFDIDKVFLMIPEFDVKEYNMRQARFDFAKMSKMTNIKENSEDFEKWFEKNKETYRYNKPKIVKVKYDQNKLPQEQNRRARNNMLIDIVFNILTNPDTAEKINNPGNFDKAKLSGYISDIITDKEMLEKFAEKYKLMTNGKPNVKDVTAKILDISRNQKLDELSKFRKDTKKVRSQLTVDTFIYNHVQNMTGGALIGMYANNTTMQAKYQNSNLELKPDYVFKINGRWIKSLHDSISQLGERISKNCANFSAASVDNVKDPVLASLLQNTKTANITAFMLRAGMSIEEIGLLFAQPIVRNCIKETGGLEELKSFINAYEKEASKIGITSSNYVRGDDMTSEQLLQNVLDNNFVEDMTETQYGKHLNNIIASAQMMLRIVNLSKPLSDMTKISRADSPNGAIKPSIAGAVAQVKAVEAFERNLKKSDFPFTGTEGLIKNNAVSQSMSRDEKREIFMKSKTPMLQAFYSLGIDLALKTLGKEFIQTHPKVQQMVDELYTNSPYFSLSDSVLNTFYRELTEFALTKTKLFGDDNKQTFDEKRDYYLYDFPKVFMDFKATHPELKKLNVFKKLEVENGDIVFKRAGRLTPLMRQNYSSDFDSALFNEDPEITKLAIDLFMYAYYKEGLKFGPHSFGNLFSPTFKTQFKDYIDCLRNLKGEIENDYFNRFLAQFYANNFNLKNLIPSLKSADFNDDGSFTVKSKFVRNKNIDVTFGNHSYKYVIVNDKLYMLQDEGKEISTYIPAITLSDVQKSKRGVKYNANMDATKLSEIMPDENRIKKNQALNPKTKDSVEDALFNSDLESQFKNFDEADMDSLSQLDDNTGESKLADKYSTAAGAKESESELC